MKSRRNFKDLPTDHAATSPSSSIAVSVFSDKSLKPVDAPKNFSDRATLDDWKRWFGIRTD